MNTVTQVDALPYDPTYRLPALENDAPVYVTTTHTWQVTHSHHVSDIGRDGIGGCHGCGASMWSPMWVADGFYGEHTLAWIDGVLVIVHSQLDEQAEALVAQVLGAVEVEQEPVILAAFDPNERASTRRPGIPVPAMQYGVLTLSD